MDRLRALQYFVAAAEGGSFSAAARSLDVSTAAVAKLVAALEGELGMPLFERRPGGLALTAAGATYLESCGPGLELLAEADERARATAGRRLSGTVVIGTQVVLATECLNAALPAFHERHPDIQLDLRTVATVSEPAAGGVDVFLLMGWPQNIGHLVHRRIGATSFVVCASPSYWARHGMPGHPRELAQHECLALRGNTGTLMDLWTFNRGGERVAVTVRGWLTCDNSHRNTLVDCALAGAGVVRIIDWNSRPHHEVATGALVEVFRDWQHDDVPAVNLLYSAAVRRVLRVRAVIDFLTQLFERIEQERFRRDPATAQPFWLARPRQRASASARRAPTPIPLSPRADPPAPSDRRRRGT